MVVVAKITWSGPKEDVELLPVAEQPASLRNQSYDDASFMMRPSIMLQFAYKPILQT